MVATGPGGIEVNRISVRVVPDTSHLFEDMKADLERIERDLSINVKASVDATELTASAREAVAQAQALAGNIDVKANVDTSQVGEIENVFKRASSGATGLLSNFSLLGAGAGVLGLALIPLTAVVAGLALALAAPLAIVAGGVTIFGFLAGFAAKGTLTQIKAINTAQAHLATLTKGTAAYATAVADLKAKQAALTPVQKQFAAALDGLKNAFNDPRLSAALLKPLTDTMLLLAKVIPTLTPIIKSVSRVFDGLVQQMGKVVKSPGFKGFVDTFAHQLGPDLRAFATIAGNFFVGLGGLFSTLNDTLSKGVLKGLENISKRFADFGRTAGENKGLKSFVNYVKQNMPAVGRLITGTFGLLASAISSLAPAGTVVVEALAGIVGQIQKLGQLAGPLAGSLAAFGLGSFFGGPEVGASAAAVVALVAGFSALYRQSKPLQRIIRDLGDYFETTFLPKIQNAARDVLPAFRSSFKDVAETIRNNRGLFEVLGKAIVAIGSVAVIASIERTAAEIRLIGKAFKYGTASVKIFANITLTIFENLVSGVGLLVGEILKRFGSIVDAAAAAFGFLPGVGGRIKDAQAKFHAFADSVNGNIAGVGTTLENLRTQINEVGQQHPKFHVDSNTLSEIAHMHELQRLQIADKKFKITAQIEQSIEQATGPGGGIRRPSGLTSGSGDGTRGGTTINVNKVEAHDYNDFLKQLAAQMRARSGGGVSLAGAS
jgi:hypothetical protein